MKGITLQGMVTNILHKKVTVEQAKDFAHKNFGELCAYIRAEQISSIMKERTPEVKKPAERIAEPIKIKKIKVYEKE